MDLSDPKPIIHNLISLHSLNLKTRGCHEMKVAPCHQASCLLEQSPKKVFPDLG
jgi:hypothetical protein